MPGIELDHPVAVVIERRKQRRQLGHGRIERLGRQRPHPLGQHVKIEGFTLGEGDSGQGGGGQQGRSGRCGLEKGSTTEPAGRF